MGNGMASRPVCVAAQKRGGSADPFSILALLCSQCVAALAEVTGIFMGDCGFILGTASCLHVSGDGGEGGHGLLAVQDSAGTVAFQSFWNIPVGQLMCSVSV